MNLSALTDASCGSSRTTWPRLLFIPSMQSHSTPPTPDLPLLQGASQVIQDYFVKDSQVIPDTGELLVLRRSVQPRAQRKILIPSPQLEYPPRPHTQFLLMTTVFHFKKGG
jgi:hypothetical protein